MMKNAILKGILTAVVGLVLSVPAFAQLSAKEQKAVDKSVELYNKGSYDKAISKIAKVQQNHLFDEKLWQNRVIYEEARYNTYYIKALIKAYKAGKSEVNDPKVTQYLQSMLVQCLLATMLADHQTDASRILRVYIVDPEVDKDISEKAEKAYSDGNDFYNDSKWNSAIGKYKEALEAEPKYYAAAFSIGKAYRENEDYPNAITYFKKAAEIAPGRALPYQFMADCYMKQKQWEDAKNACIDGIIIYPDVAFFNQLADIAEKLGKTFDRHWGLRITFPNEMGVNQDPLQSEPWASYRAAKDRVSDYCNDDGVITKKNSVTTEKYLEVYSWTQLLKNASEEDEKTYDNFTFAKQMQKEGYLDCYCFVSDYHVDLQKQYEDFSKNNADRIRTYINTYLLK